jgi:DNA-binding response OmpR family regulator
MGVTGAVGYGGDEGLVDVLFVGQDSALADMYRFKLEMDGYRVRIVETLRDWSPPAAGAKPDLVFVDLGTARYSNLLDARHLRLHPVLKDVPAILLSAEAPEELLARGLHLTPLDYLLRVRFSGIPSAEEWGHPPVTSSLH